MLEMDSLGARFEEVREQFPSLERKINGYPAAYFDGPGGSQVPQSVIDSISWYYRTCNSNTHGCFATSRETDTVLENAREAMASFLNAASRDEISFGANMTTLNFSLSHAIGRHLVPGDEILITQLDHEANRGPWLHLQSLGIKVREVIMRPEGVLDYDDFLEKVNERTRVVAVGHASNALGTVNDIARIRRETRAVGAWMVVDAVHSAPHFPLDVQSLGADFLLCSAYKFYGPHVGILYSRKNLLDQLQTDRLRTQEAQAPYRIETGTLNHAAIAGVAAAVDFISNFGTGENQRTRLSSAMNSIQAYEHRLAQTLYGRLSQIEGVELFGPSFDEALRAPTISFRISGRSPSQVANSLGEKGLLVWDGDFYAVRAVEILGLSERGGLVRVGMSLYNSGEEVDRLLDRVAQLARKT